MDFKNTYHSSQLAPSYREIESDQWFCLQQGSSEHGRRIIFLIDHVIRQNILGNFFKASRIMNGIFIGMTTSEVVFDYY